MASIDAIIKLMVFTITSTVKYRVTLQQVYNIAKRAMSTADVDGDTLHRAAKAAVERALGTGPFGVQEVTIPNKDGRPIKRHYVVPHASARGVSEHVTPWENDDFHTARQIEGMNCLQSVEFALEPRVVRAVQALGSSVMYRVGGREDGRVKYAPMLRSLKAWLDEHKPEDTFRQSVFYSKGRYYYSRNAITHMAGSLARSMVCLAHPSEAGTEEDRYRAWAIAQDSYKLTRKNYRKFAWKFYYEVVLVAEQEKAEYVPSSDKPLAPRTQACANAAALAKKLGIKPKKIMDAYACALALIDMVDSASPNWKRINRCLGRSRYIWQQDASADGFQRVAGLSGCEVLGYYTNIQGAPEPQSLYNQITSMAKAYVKPEPIGVYFWEEGKWFVMRLGYGSSQDGLAKGLIFNDPESFLLATTDGAWDPEKVKKLWQESFDIFNPDWVDVWDETGIENAWEVASAYSKAFYNATMDLSPKLREFIKCIRQTMANALEKGIPFYWTLWDGTKVFISDMEMDKESAPQSVTFTIGGRKIRASILEQKKSNRTTMAPPMSIHPEDGSHVIENAISMAKAGQPYVSIHDSHGTGLGGLSLMYHVHRENMKKLYWDHPYRFFTHCSTFGVTPNKKIFKDGAVTLSLNRLMKSKYIIR